MRTLNDLVVGEGATVLLRADFNVPIQKGVVVDPFRIEKTLLTINELLQKGVRLVILSHIENDEDESLKPVFEYLLAKGLPISFEGSSEKGVIEDSVKKLESGRILLLENIRRFKEEKENNEDFSKWLASLGEAYVNDAFAVSHRKHASVVGIPKFLKSCAGRLIEEEVRELSTAFNPHHPFLFILGGAKFETKEPLITKFLDIADNVFVGGALGNDFFKAKGYEVGGSMVSGSIPEEAIVNHPNLLLPEDMVVRASDERRALRTPDSVHPQEVISDAGPQTIEMLRTYIMEARLILWNGPLGYYEKGYAEGTKDIAKLLSQSRARSIVGGGDTVAAIESLGIMDRLSFVSTGGGAMLDFLAEGTLPALEVLK